MMDSDKNILNCLDHNRRVWTAAVERAQMQLANAQNDLSSAQRGLGEAETAFADMSAKFEDKAAETPAA